MSLIIKFYRRAKNSLIQLVSILILVGCVNDYKIKDGNIYYINHYMIGQTSEKKLDNADVNSFSTVKGGMRGELGKYYAKDHHQVYFQSEVIREADPQTFTVVGSWYATDKSKIYYKSDLLRGDPDKFKLLQYGYAKDDNFVYRQGALLDKVVDIKTFAPINKDGWEKDKFCLYTDGIPIINADYKSFEILNSSYAKDKFRVYYKLYASADIVANADPKTFKITGPYKNIGKDKNACYFEGKQIDCE